jgi:hypothetical protein
MPTVQLPDDEKYGKAIGLLLDVGGLFRTKPTRQLVVNPAQLQALQRAGLVPNGKGARKRGQKKTWPVSPGRGIPGL